MNAAHGLDNLRPVLAFGRDQSEVLAVWLRLWDLQLGGAPLQLSAPLRGAGYVSFHVHLSEEVGPGLKAVLDRVTWFQVHLTQGPPPGGNRG